jgi:flavin reductase (DIM6/NTAB) family NADH-FMN oxidoreductase RutF
MGRFATGVTIITTHLDGEVHGMTANAVTSVSLEPPLVLVCLDKAADSHDIIDRSGVYAVNILSGDQDELGWRFAVKDSPQAHHMADVPHRVGATGSPIIDGCLAYLDCRVVERLPGGDHTVFMAEVVDAGLLDGSGPLIFYEGRFTGLP